MAIPALSVYFAKLPMSIALNLFMLFIFSVELLIKNVRRAWDPRTWITIGTFYVLGTLAVTFLVQIPLDILALIATGKTLTGFIPSTGSWLSDYAVSSFISVAIFTLLLSRIVTALMQPAEKAKIFRRTCSKASSNTTTSTSRQRRRRRRSSLYWVWS